MILLSSNQKNSRSGLGCLRRELLLFMSIVYYHLKKLSSFFVEIKHKKKKEKEPVISDATDDAGK